MNEVFKPFKTIQSIQSLNGNAKKVDLSMGNRNKFFYLNFNDFEHVLNFYNSLKLFSLFMLCLKETYCKAYMQGLIV